MQDCIPANSMLHFDAAQVLCSHILAHGDGDQLSPSFHCLQMPGNDRPSVRLHQGATSHEPYANSPEFNPAKRHRLSSTPGSFLMGTFLNKPLSNHSIADFDGCDSEFPPMAPIPGFPRHRRLRRRCNISPTDQRAAAGSGIIALSALAEGNQIYGAGSLATRNPTAKSVS